MDEGFWDFVIGDVAPASVDEFIVGDGCFGVEGDDGDRFAAPTGRRAADHDDVGDSWVGGEGAFDFSSRSGKVPYGVASVAQAALQPCVALAGQVLVGSREMRALGVESAYSVVDLVGEERAFADPAGSLAELAERVARTWSR